MDPMGDIPGVFFFWETGWLASVPSQYFQGDLAPDLQMVLCELHRLSGSEEFPTCNLRCGMNEVFFRGVP